MITTVLSWIWISSGLLLILFVLLHSPKGDGMGGLAASGSSTFTSSSSAEAGAQETSHVQILSSQKMKINSGGNCSYAAALAQKSGISRRN
mgnify:CR=1 FL=1